MDLTCDLRSLELALELHLSSLYKIDRKHIKCIIRHYVVNTETFKAYKEGVFILSIYYLDKEYKIIQISKLDRVVNNDYNKLWQSCYGSLLKEIFGAIINKEFDKCFKDGK